MSDENPIASDTSPQSVPRTKRVNCTYTDTHVSRGWCQLRNEIKPHTKWLEKQYRVHIRLHKCRRICMSHSGDITPWRLVFSTAPPAPRHSMHPVLLWTRLRWIRNTCWVLSHFAKIHPTRGGYVVHCVVTSAQVETTECGDQSDWRQQQRSRNWPITVPEPANNNNKCEDFPKIVIFLLWKSVLWLTCTLAVLINIWNTTHKRAKEVKHI